MSSLLTEWLERRSFRRRTASSWSPVDRISGTARSLTTFKAFLVVFFVDVLLVIAPISIDAGPTTTQRNSRSGLASRRPVVSSPTSTVPPTTPEPDVEIDRLYLGRGTLRRLTCPLVADPPSTVIVWTRNGSVLEPISPGGMSTSTSDVGAQRARISRTGTLVIRSADTGDEGIYVCAVYSPVGPAEKSRPVRVLVRGEPCSIFY